MKIPREGRKSGVLAVVMGPSTRLADALLKRGGGPYRDWLLVCRSPVEAERVAARYPWAAVHRAWESGSLPAPGRDMAIFCCALGPIHPGRPDLETDAAGVLRDLGFLERLLREGGGTTHVVFVSTVLALSPPARRRYYAGWKSAVEAALEALAGRRGALLSILYPGRLIEARDVRLPLSWLHTTYEGLAGVMRRAAGRRKPLRKVIGADARLLLLARGIAEWAKALHGRA